MGVYRLRIRQSGTIPAFLPFKKMNPLIYNGKELMAGGWTRDGAIHDQIDDTVSDAVKAARKRMPKGDSAKECVECGDEIPKARRDALPGVKTCVLCQAERDGQHVNIGINRRGSKDSQLR